MTKKEFEKYLARDGACVHCGETEAVAPNHRAGRGMGGSKNLDKPSNIVVLCSVMNSLIESDAFCAEKAKAYGWKLERWQIPEESPVFDVNHNAWFYLDNNFQRKATKTNS